MDLKLTVSKHKISIAVCAITLFALIIRAYQITWQCQMVDEIFTSQYITNTVYYIVQNSLAADYNPPTYYLCAKLSSFIFGSINNFSIRFPALIFGTLAVPVAYLAARELKNNTLGILTAIIVAIDFPLIYYSENARPYSLALLCFTIFIYFYIKIFRGNTTNKNMILLGITAALCLWSHYFSAVPMAVTFLILILKNRKSIKIPIVTIILGILPMAVLFGWGQFGKRISNQNSVLAIHWNQMALYLPNEILCWMWIPIVPLIFYSAIKIKDKIINSLIVIALSAPIGLVGCTLLTGSFMPRYAVLVAPVLIMVAMYPVADYLDRLSLAKKIALAASIILFAFMLNSLSLYSLWVFSWCPAMNLPIPEHGIFL